MLYFALRPYGYMPYPIKCVFLISEVMVQILQMMELLLIHDYKDDSQLGFFRKTDEVDSSVILTELWVALLREFNNQRLSPWGRLFSFILDPVTDLLHQS